MNGQPFDLFLALKAGTAGIHKQTEERITILRPEFDLPAYVVLLEHFYGFWSPVENRLLQVRDLHDPQLGLESRMKSSLLREDLQFLGRQSETVRECGDLPAVETFLQGLGCLYVLEGSTLGARFIAPRLENHLQLRAGTGASFFNAYGDSVGRRWTEFKAFTSPRVSASQADEVVASARQTFECFHSWLGARDHSETPT